MNDTLTDSDKEAVYQILLDQLEINGDQLTDDAHLEKDLGADSLDEIQIVMALEEKFHLTIPTPTPKKPRPSAQSSISWRKCSRRTAKRVPSHKTNAAPQKLNECAFFVKSAAVPTAPIQ